ncbi:MAG: Ig-like domain-containing protein [Chloroflexota bacterium]
MRRRQWMLIPLIIMIVVAGVIFASAPRLEDVFPRQGAEWVPAAIQMELTFSQLMQPGSVEEHLSIDPPRAGAFEWEGKRLVFTPHQDWSRGEVVTIELKAGARSVHGLPMLRGYNWSFTIAPSLLLYLWPADGPADLHTLDPLSGKTVSLTNTPLGVLDYAIGDRGMTIFYSASLEDRGSGIYRLDRVSGETALIFDCPDTECGSLAPSPGTRWLAFTKASPMERDDLPLIQVWLLNLSNGESFPVDESGHLTSIPCWSTDGLLAYYDETEKAFMFYDPGGGLVDRLSNQTGEVGSWSPNGNDFIVPELVLVSLKDASNRIVGVTLSSHLTRYNLVMNSWVDMTRADNLEDMNPVFSPNGIYIAFTRKSLDPNSWTPGRQVWLMRSDGTQAYPLTANADFNHSNLTWSSDSRFIAYVRSDQTALTEPLEVWVYDLEQRNAMRLVIGGYEPQWMP